MLKVINNSFAGRNDKKRSDNTLRDALVCLHESSIEKKQKELDSYTLLYQQGNRIKKRYSKDLDVVQFVDAMKAMYLLPQIKQRKDFIRSEKTVIKQIYKDFE